MSLEQFFFSINEELSLSSKWNRFFKGKIVLSLYSELLIEYAYFFNGKIYLGKVEHINQPEWKSGTKQKILSMLLEPDVIIRKIKKTDKIIEDIVQENLTLTGMDGKYNFTSKNEAVWTSNFTGEEQVLTDFELGEMMMSYFTGLHDWELKKE